VGDALLEPVSPEFGETTVGVEIEEGVIISRLIDELVITIGVSTSPGPVGDIVMGSGPPGVP